MILLLVGMFIFILGILVGVLLGEYLLHKELNIIEEIIDTLQKENDEYLTLLMKSDLKIKNQKKEINYLLRNQKRLKNQNSELSKKLL